jgi:hypothetical protein
MTEELPHLRHWPLLGIENVSANGFSDDKEVFLASIAISLKRIADVIAGDPQRLGLIDAMFEMQSRTRGNTDPRE